MDNEEQKPQVSTQPFLILASTVTAVGCLVILIDLYAPRDTIPQTLVNLSMVLLASTWNIYFVWTATRRIYALLQDKLSRDSYARGFVDGIQRRPEAPSLRSVS